MNRRPLNFTHGLVPAALAIAALLFSTPPEASSTPSFARQTGLSCATCHTVFPHLTPFGRDFKLHGYTKNNTQLINDLMQFMKGDSIAARRTILQIPDIPMVSARIASRWNEQSGGDNGLVPTGPVTAGQGFVSTPEGYGNHDMLNLLAGSSIYVSGEISPNMGGFIEFGGPDDEGGTVSLGVLDVALVSSDATLAGQDFVYGIRAVDAMAAGDPSNTVGAWGLTGGLMGPSTHNTLFDPGNTFMEGGELFGMLGDFDGGGLYASVGVYRPTHNQSSSGYVQGAIAGGGEFDGVSGVNSYVRLSYYLPPLGTNTYSEIGGFGYFGNLKMSAPPTAELAAPDYTESYYDVGLDLQVQYIGDKNLVELFALLQDERDGSFYGTDVFTGFSDPGAAVSRQGFGLKADYYYRRTVGAYVKYLYQTSAQIKDLVVNGAVLGVGLFPWENVNLKLERTFFLTYNIGVAQYAPGPGLSLRPSRKPPSTSDFDVLAVKLQYLF